MNNNTKRNAAGLGSSFWTLICVVLVGAHLIAGCATPKGPTANKVPPAAMGDTSAQQPCPSLIELDRCVQVRLDTVRDQINAPGMTAAYVLKDGRSSAVATGVSNKTTAKRMRPHDRMLAGSTGKTLVAAVMIMLVEEGYVDLDVKISHWFGNEAWFARIPNANDITLRMLMNHSSGIPEHVVMPEFIAAIEADMQKVWRPEEIIAYIFDKQPLFPAGQGWSYADTNYILAGMIIERVVGRTFYEEATERILKPLALTDTFPSNRNPLPGLVNGYSSEKNPFPVEDEVVSNGRCAFNPQMEWTGGGFVSSSGDLAKWAKALYGGDFLKADSKKQMLHGVPAKRFSPNHRYGLGVVMRPSSHGPVYGHGGWFPGYVTMMAYYADYDMAVAIQVNSDAVASSSGLESIADEIAGAIINKQHRADSNIAQE